jgi:hypothetical protein
MNEELDTNLVSEIISAIESVPAAIPSGKGDGVWTAAIKRKLIDLGKKRDYRICTSGFPDECDQEWLCDLVWYRNDPPDHLREIGLVLESEWSANPKHIKFDFEKLPIVKSPIKVMVFQDFQKDPLRLWSLLETGIKNFQTEQAHEKYILARYQNDNDNFAFKQIIA